jgi:SsrA-binding protein
MNIAVYDFGNRENHDPTRMRKLLLHHAEIDKLIRLTEQKGLAMVPTKIYFKKNYIKLEIGVGRGKKLYDKRETLKRKEADREMAKALKNVFR